MNQLFSKGGAAALAIAALTAGAIVTPAAAIPLVNAPGTVGPLAGGGNTFTNIGCSITGGGSPSNCNQINVTVDAAGSLNLNSGFVAAFGSFTDALISYTVTNASGISGIDLGFNGSFLGLAVASVTETVYSDAAHTNVVGHLTVSCSPIQLPCDLVDPPNEGPDIALTGTYSTLYVTKDIVVSSMLAGFSTISSVSQSFHTTVPEPASLALMGFGLLGLAFARRKAAPQA